MEIQTLPDMCKDEAIVLRTYPYSSTSMIVSWLTASHGRLSTLVKGAFRPKSAFVGQIDLFYTCELVYYARERDGLHIIKEVTPLAARSGLRRHWAAMACASYFADLVQRTVQIHTPLPHLYRDLTAAIDGALEADPIHNALFWFEFRALHAEGVSPRIETCVRCGCAIDPAHAKQTLLAHEGGFLCTRCHSAHKPTQGGLILSRDTYAAICRLNQAERIQGVLKLGLTPSQIKRLQTATGLLLEHHLHLAPTARDVALSVCDRWKRHQDEHVIA